MSFLTPLFLIGLAALAIPVLLHLTQRQRREPVRFPSLAFVRRVPFRTTERRRIRDWLLFLLRASAIALLVAAFARPFLARAGFGAAGAGTAREVVLLLDRSASMGYGDRWDRALEAARRVASDLAPGDRLTVVRFAETPEVMGPATGDAVTAAAYLTAARPDGGVTRFGPALELAGDLVEQSDLPRRAVVLVSDFQQAGWDGGTDIRLPAGTVLETVAVGGDAPQNLAVTGVTLQRSPDDGGRVVVTARVTNLGTSDAEVRARLGTGTQTLHEVRARVTARDAIPVRFPAIALPPSPTPGWVRLDGDRLGVDDERRFVLRPIPRIPVLLLEPSGASSREVVYLRRALSIGRDPLIESSVRTTPSAAELGSAAVVVLNDAPFPSGEAGRRLLRFVEQGGGILWAIGPRAGAVPEAVGAALGTAARSPADRLTDRGGALGVADYGHPVFAPFQGTRGGDYSAVRVYRYRRLALPDSGRVLAWTDDGGAILGETRYGMGRALLWGSDLSNVWNDLPLRAVFLPTVHQAVRYLAGHREPPASYEVGSALHADELFPGADGELVLEAPDGTRVLIPAGTRMPLPLPRAGFYELRSPRGEIAVPVAVNLDPAESDLTELDRDVFLAAVAAPEGVTTAGPAGVLTAAERERRQRIWWYLALAALIALVAESAFTALRPKGAGA